jgi:transposase
MRGRANPQMQMFSYIPIDSWVEEKHPLRPILDMVERVLAELSPEFDAIYSATGRPSIPPEQLLKALLLQVLFTIRSEGQLLEHLRFNLLYRWFVGLSPDARIWDETVFTKNRDRLLSGKIADRFFEQVLEEAKRRGLTSSSHFIVDGTLVQAWASFKSFQPKEPDADQAADEKKSGDDNDDFGSGGDAGNPAVDFRGEKRGDATFTQATGTAEREAAHAMALDLPGKGPKTLGSDKAYDVAEHVEDLRLAGVTPHVATKQTGSALDGRTTRHPGYAVSQRKRKLVEEIFGWLKTVGPMRRPHLRGRAKLGWWFKFSVAVYNLLRIRNLCAA